MGGTHLCTLWFNKKSKSSTPGCPEDPLRFIQKPRVFFKVSPGSVQSPPSPVLAVVAVQFLRDALSGNTALGRARKVRLQARLTSHTLQTAFEVCLLNHSVRKCAFCGNVPFQQPRKSTGQGCKGYCCSGSLESPVFPSTPHLLSREGPYRSHSCVDRVAPRQQFYFSLSFSETSFQQQMLYSLLYNQDGHYAVQYFGISSIQLTVATLGMVLIGLQVMP